MIQDIHNISQHIILISTASTFYGQFKVLATFMPVILGKIIFLLGKRSDQSSISLWWTKLIQDIHDISQHIILISTACAFYGQFKVLATFILLYWGNNFSPGETQRPILIISMVDKIDPRYTQHITTYNTNLNDIYFLWPIQSARGLYACYNGGNNFFTAS